MAEDKNNNVAKITLTFFVDSKKPRINKVLPTSKFADGIFQVQYTEANLKSVELIYGNLLNGQKTVPLTGCISGEKQWCDIDVDLSEYDGQIIEYFFRIKDISENIKESSPKRLEVDTTFPMLNNPNSFWDQGEGKNSKYVYFIFNITEKNFDEVLYIDYSDTRPKWTGLCSSLDKEEGTCEKKKTFRKGHHHILDIQIFDEAGNSVSTKRIEFDVDY